MESRYNVPRLQRIHRSNVLFPRSRFHVMKNSRSEYNVLSLQRFRPLWKYVVTRLDCNEDLLSMESEWNVDDCTVTDVWWCGLSVNTFVLSAKPTSANTHHIQQPTSTTTHPNMAHSSEPESSRITSSNRVLQWIFVSSPHSKYLNWSPWKQVLADQFCKASSRVNSSKWVLKGSRQSKSSKIGSDLVRGDLYVVRINSFVTRTCFDCGKIFKLCSRQIPVIPCP